MFHIQPELLAVDVLHELYVFRTFGEDVLPADIAIAALGTKLGAEVASGSPEQLAAEIRNEYEKWSHVVREIGLQVRD